MQTKCGQALMIKYSILLSAKKEIIKFYFGTFLLIAIAYLLFKNNSKNIEVKSALLFICMSLIFDGIQSQKGYKIDFYNLKTYPKSKVSLFIKLILCEILSLKIFYFMNLLLFLPLMQNKVVFILYFLLIYFAYAIFSMIIFHLHRRYPVVKLLVAISIFLIYFYITKI